MSPVHLHADGALALARSGLLRASARLERQGVPGTAAEGQLIRPIVALAGCGAESAPAGFWDAVLAVQLAHEASLLHDDIIDGAATRRGVPTLASEKGVARALVEGDHLLTAAYRAAAETGSPAFVALFARAVERTVAGERAQGRAAGQVLDDARYEEIVLGKSGELFGCALAAAAVLREEEGAAAVFELGRRLGLLYQRVDDLLDYCPAAATGKAPLADYRQRRWTWVLREAPELELGGDAEEALRVMHGRGAEGSPLERALLILRAEAASLRHALATAVPAPGLLDPIIDGWLSRAARAVATPPASQPGPPAAAGVLRARAPEDAGTAVYMAGHSRSFRFASLLLPRAERERTARIYAYCRITDDLVDQPPAGCDPAELLDGWMDLSRRAYGGEASGIPLLDRVMGEMAGRGVPFRYAELLAEGMRMDLAGRRYPTLGELRGYTYRVASVVGLWLSRSWGVREPSLLERAARMGHAMQMTNILRDVGEDWRRGRLYLPLEALARHGLDEADVGRMARGAPVCDRYRALVEELMRGAEADYAAGLEAVRCLPPPVGRPVAVAAHVYRGIHARLRRHGYDNLTRRAGTGPAAKLRHAVAALAELYRPAALPAPVTGAARR